MESSIIEMERAPCLQIVDEDDEDDNIKNEIIHLDPRFGNYSLADCLNSPKLFTILGKFDSKDDAVRLLCQEFNIHDLNKLDDYKDLARKENFFFHKLLRDEIEIDSKSETKRDYLKNLQTLQNKLFLTNNCRLTCKSIKNYEKEILQETEEYKNNPLKSLFGFKIFSPYELEKAKSDCHGVFTLNAFSRTKIERKNEVLKSSSSTASSSSSSSSSSFSFSCDRQKTEVILFYRLTQKKIIENFMEKAKRINSNIDFIDIYKVENDLELVLKKDNPVFILFDKDTEKVLNESRDSCKCEKECHCSFYRKFFQLIYKMFLNNKNYRYFTFLMENENFNCLKSFRYKYLLKQKETCDQIVYQPPRLIPDENSNLNKKLIKFIANFNYPNYQISNSNSI